ncbi:hypothetical protein LTR70_009742 [Exophiala xenobiotica]|uniref:Uncharacterized protein n=1 Tax=Lithohypha guttulata TaxID=1690604 RepID=A0ABR0JX71_9EURO|nr:hypothetical protein LTR24_009622 [Lithohypha guttulata]KAK5310089.1 hypothetical protein LTR70_009742 [Exophiala xenobiotica]
MSESKHDFKRSFRKLTEKIESQTNDKSIISFGDELNKLFRDTTAPRSSDALQRFAKLLEGPERQGLFLRLDGPAIFLIVSTVLQFPFSSLLSKTIYFFMDVLMIYKSDSKAFEALRQCLDARELEKEVKRRQRHIFHQLMRRLRDIVFDHSMHTKVRRLVAQLIMSLCNDHVPGWRGLMDQSKG